MYITVPILVRYGSRSKIKMRTVKIEGSVHFALPTVRLKNGTVTVALAVKNGTVRYGHGTVRYGHGTDTVRYGHGTDTVRYGHGDKFGRNIVFLLIKIIFQLLDF